jgi:hypothetical protein
LRDILFKTLRDNEMRHDRKRNHRARQSVCRP